jgi:hypothetical protein
VYTQAQSDATFLTKSNPSYTGTLTGGTGVVNIGSGQVYKDASGNVGIGTSSPVEKLTVNGGIVSTGDSVLPSGASGVTLGYDTANSIGNIYSVTSGTAWRDLAIRANQTVFFGGATERMRIDSSGNVLVGTDTASSLSGYTVVGQFKNSIGIVSGTANEFSGALLRQSSSSNSISLDADPANLRANSFLGFGVDGSERMRLNSSGDLIIGGTTAIALLTVGGLKAGTPVAAFSNFTTSGNVACVATSLESNGNNTSSYHLRATTQNINNWYLYGNGTSSFSSDQRLKKNIETTRDGYIDDLMKLRVVKYNWRNDADGTPKELGLIAQEVEQVFAGLVQDDLNKISENDDTIYKQLKASVLPFMLLKAIQEQQVLIQSQADTITAMEARLTALESK